MKTTTVIKTLIFFTVLFNAGATFAQRPVSSGLIAHYCFDGNADDAIGSKHCTVYGASLTTDRLGRANSAYFFDGVDDYIQLPNDVWFHNDFTVSGWLYEESYKHMARFFEIGNGPVNGNAVLYSPSAPSPYYDALHVHRDSCLPYTFQTEYSGAFPFKTWVFVTVIQRGNRGEIWKNGIKLTISSGPMNPACSLMRSQNYFGQSTWAGDEFYHGKMDDIRIYNRALSAAEIDTLFKLDKTCQQQSNIAAQNTANEFYLSQNAPNPTAGRATIVSFHSPIGSKQSVIQIIDITGRAIADYPLNHIQGTLEIPIEGLNNGVYFYSLIADGQVLDRKKMIVQH